jgi:NADH:ubiquinone oxidoreductase subunit 5 (subunit L)/multisubunit Na+/H+ antiporter MnhA subunit
MEGPTPVSALIHAATMVTAGIFVTIRSASIFEYAESISFLIMVFVAITAAFSAIMACFQTDIKKTIAYSTCSQLVYMFVACGVSFYSLSLFHLFNHAFFKALCFVSAGASIHTVMGEQDVS